MARPTKLTDARRADLLQWIRQGLTREHAALQAGIDPSTLTRWIARARAAKSGFWYDFRLELEKADAAAEAALWLRMQVHSRQNWRAAAWCLERRWPEKYGPPALRLKRADDEGGGNEVAVPAAVVTALAEMTPDQVSAAAGVDLDVLDQLSLPTEQ